MFLGWMASLHIAPHGHMIMQERSMAQGFYAGLGEDRGSPEKITRHPCRERANRRKSFGAKGFSGFGKTQTHDLTHTDDFPNSRGIPAGIAGSELSGPASGAVSAHNYKGPDGVREPDTARPATVAVADGACRRPMLATREGGGAVVCFCSARHSAFSPMGVAP
jgi:hypothetical protein